MKLTSNFPDRLREAMGDKSVSDFARQLGISKQSVSAYLNGTRTPKQFVIRAIASALDVDEPWLCGYDTPKSRPHLSGSGTSISPEAMEIALAYDRADEKSQGMVRYALAEYMTPVKIQEGQTAV